MRIGIDLGGTKIEIAALADDGQLRLRERVPAPHADYQATLRVLSALVEGVEVKLGDRGSIGVGIPGAISPKTGLVKNANSTWLNGQPLQQDLTVALGRPLRIANDANCFALSEAVDGAGKNHGMVFGIIAGTGVGGGIAEDGRVHIGRHAIAGEWGHNPLPWMRDDERPGPSCYCGKTGCIETFLSGPALARDHGHEAGEPLQPAEIAARAARGDARSAATMERYYDRFARSLAAVINILDPDIVVLGGGLSNIEQLYSQIPPRLSAYVFSDACTTPVVKNVHGDSSGVRGAAWLWPAEARPRPQVPGELG
jgi:fructokinase